jgi:hypothetical protein
MSKIKTNDKMWRAVASPVGDVLLTEGFVLKRSDKRIVVQGPGGLGSNEGYRAFVYDDPGGLLVTSAGTIASWQPSPKAALAVLRLEAQQQKDDAAARLSLAAAILCNLDKAEKAQGS